MDCVHYKKGFKYQITTDYVVSIPIKPIEDCVSSLGYVTLTTDGLLTIKKGYAWDGPSGPTFNTADFMRGSLVHDALYQLMRERGLRNIGARHRKAADALLRMMCIEDGMSEIRAWWIWKGLRYGGRPAADPSNVKKIIKAPKKCR